MFLLLQLQMLDSMQKTHVLHVLEASDVANAVFWWYRCNNAFSGESANGDYPVESVATMARIDIKSENATRQHKAWLDAFEIRWMLQKQLVSSVAETAENLNIKTIVAATKSGHTARMISSTVQMLTSLAVTFDDRTSWL